MLEGIVFNEDSKNEDSKIDSDFFDDKQAAEMLEKNEDAKKNISKLLRLGWRFVTPARLSRIDSFEPAPELPFLVIFMGKKSQKDKKKIYYRSYDRKVLLQSSIEEELDEEEKDKEEKELEGTLFEKEGDGGIDENKIEIEHNRTNCILTSKIFQKISYGNQLVTILSRIKLNKIQLTPGGNYVDNEMIKACKNVKVLVLQYANDPLEQKLQKVFVNTIKLKNLNDTNIKGKVIFTDE
eukprot:454818_1